MEINLLGSGIYSIPEWEGALEVNSLKLFQIKRLVGSRNNLSLFRKFLKIFNSDKSPVRFPEGFKPELLDVSHFTQILIAVAALSKGRQIKRTYKCPKCNALNPRVIDIIKAFEPKEARLEGGKKEVSIGEEKVTCSYISVKDFITINELADNVDDMVTRNPKGVIVSMDLLNDNYGELYSFEDEEDVVDFKESLMEVGIIAMKVENGKDLNEKLQWMFNMQGDDIKTYNDLSQTIVGLSPIIENKYSTVCTNCKGKLDEKLEALDYFFAIEWTSSTN